MYTKDSKEYISNGHYFINGRHFLSIWTFKNKCLSLSKPEGVSNRLVVDRFHVQNTNEINYTEASELVGAGISHHRSKPDIKTRFETIEIFPLEDLNKKYNRKLNL